MSPSRPPSEGNPWQTTASRVVYANAWITVREDAVVRPDGRDGVYGVVQMRNLALGVVPVFDDGDTVLVGQHRYTLDAYSWEIPEGGGDPQHEPLAEAARELQEETGLTARRWTPLGVVHTSNSVTDEVSRLYLARDLAAGSPQPEGTEQLQRWRLPLADAVEMALDGRLTDSLTVIGLLRAGDELGLLPRR